MIKLDKRKIKRKLTKSKNYFLSLATSIIHQQISTKVAKVIEERFKKLFGRRAITPKNFLSLKTSQLRGAGLSTQKIRYITDLAQKFLDKTIDEKRLHTLKDEDIKEHLIKVKGIGGWTADMFLIFALNRPNVLPLGDLGIVKGFQKVFSLKKTPDHKTMLNLSKRYDGDYTRLSLFLWQSLED